MSRETQQQRILQFCREHGSITNREAVQILNINSPTSRISELRKSNLYDVVTQLETSVNAFGENVRFFRYFIKEK